MDKNNHITNHFYITEETNYGEIIEICCYKEPMTLAEAEFEAKEWLREFDGKYASIWYVETDELALNVEI